VIDAAVGVAATTPRRDAPFVVRRLLGAVHRVECTTAVLAIGAMAGVLILDVVGREVLGPLLVALGSSPGPTGVYGAPKLALYALALATYAGLGVATARGTHLVPRVAFGVVPPSWSPAMNRLADAVSGVLMLAVAAGAALLVQGSYAHGIRAPVLDWPLWAVQLLVPVGFASAALRYLAFAAWPALRPAAPAASDG
jgi:TRAP-type C4-dicarboxylate transport system permease small subunit